MLPTPPRTSAARPGPVSRAQPDPPNAILHVAQSHWPYQPSGIIIHRAGPVRGDEAMLAAGPPGKRSRDIQPTIAWEPR
jgi:hypothetical protein